MSVFIISAPAETTKEDVVNSLRSKIAGQAEIRPFRLPDFKIGTLDSLVVLSDDLSKYDQSFEGITNKIAENLKTLVHGDVEQWKNNLIVDDKSVDNYLQGFQWNDMKYRTDKSLREICDIIVQDVNSIDSLMKSRMTKYNLIKSQLTSLQRKQTGNLSVKSLVDIVKKDHFVYSEYLTTLIVAVPKNLVKEWYASYETLCPMVVPRSSELIEQDDEFSLFNVTLFKKVVDDFKNACREKKFIVRDFTFDENKISQEQKDLAAINAEEKDQWQTTLRLCKANFGESFSCWMHIKALRVYVESILRYGLPPNFQPMIIKPKNKNERRVRDILAQHYAKLGEKNTEGKSKKKEQIDENIQMLLGDKEYYPYVSFDINWKI
ncbi:ATPase, V1 complex, subunit C, partial [Anaeromyces robustus]|jgi:V-type H+-transporting ATPase subunit C